MKTRTGNFPLGFRLRDSSDWEKELAGAIAWAQANSLEVIDLKDGDHSPQAVIEAGLRVGSVDLPEWQGMISPDKGKRTEAVVQNAAYIQACAVFGPMNHFVVMLPDQPELSRAENFDYMVESFSELAPVMEAHEARLVVEGWPGPGALCCTPEGYRAFFKACPSPALGTTYDPSHLLRMGIDPLRFLHEFGDRVFHVHGKDLELLAENLYEYGSEQPPTFAQPIRFGALHWRYTIPGQGIMRWTEAFRFLAANHYAGCVSIELEDANFADTEEAEKFGVLQGVGFLAGC